LAMWAYHHGVFFAILTLSIFFKALFNAK